MNLQTLFLTKLRGKYMVLKKVLAKSFPMWYYPNVAAMHGIIAQLVRAPR